MPTVSISTILQVVMAMGLLNVWLVRAGSATSYRGGDARSLKEDFAAYGLPDLFFYLVGVLKISSALMLIAGIWIETLVLQASAIVAVLMVGALVMHVKVKVAAGGRGQDPSEAPSTRVHGRRSRAIRASVLGLWSSERSVPGLCADFEGRGHRRAQVLLVSDLPARRSRQAEEGVELLKLGLCSDSL